VFAAARPEPHPRMLDRFLVVAEANGVAARVVVNKVELAGDDDDQVALIARLVTAGFPVLEFSAHSAGLEDLFIEITEGRME